VLGLQRTIDVTDQSTQGNNPLLAGKTSVREGPQQRFSAPFHFPRVVAVKHQERHDRRMYANGIANTLRKIRYLFIPRGAVIRFGLDRRENLIDDHPFQCLAILDVAIQRHGSCTEFRCNGSHGKRSQPVTVNDLQGRGRDVGGCKRTAAWHGQGKKMLCLVSLAYTVLQRRRKIMSASLSRSRSRLKPGQIVAARQIAVLNGFVALPDPNRLVHLQFRRFAGCPVCDLHLHSIARRHDEIVSAGILEVAVFHSDATSLHPFTAELPFAIVADLEKRLYAEFGAEASPRALLNSRAWFPIVRGLLRSLARILRGKQPVTSFQPDGGMLGLPADFLIAGDGNILACKYGTHLYDQWSVDDLLALAERSR
jgi:AhpC/TSA family